jgi:hypothetical protein
MDHNTFEHDYILQMLEACMDEAKSQNPSRTLDKYAVALTGFMNGKVVEGVKDMETRKDAAYLERNQVVAALAKVFPSGMARTAIEGWSEDWHGCVYIDLPTGQASWHFHDSQAYLFEGLPAYTKAWDGHTTEQKYGRLAALATMPASVNPPETPADHKYLCRAWGETDLPCVAIARSRDEVRQFYIDQWLGDDKAADYDGTPTLPRLMEEFDEHPWQDGEEISYTFEIGGVSVERVFA